VEKTGNRQRAHRAPQPRPAPTGRRRPSPATDLQPTRQQRRTCISSLVSATRLDQGTPDGLRPAGCWAGAGRGAADLGPGNRLAGHSAAGAVLRSRAFGRKRPTATSSNAQAIGNGREPAAHPGEHRTKEGAAHIAHEQPRRALPVCREIRGDSPSRASALPGARASDVSGVWIAMAYWPNNHGTVA